MQKEKLKLRHFFKNRLKKQKSKQVVGGREGGRADGHGEGGGLLLWCPTLTARAAPPGLPRPADATPHVTPLPHHSLLPTAAARHPPACPQGTPTASTCGVWTPWMAQPTSHTATHPLQSAWRCCATPRPSPPQARDVSAPSLQKQPCCNCRQLLSGSNVSFVARLLASDGAAWCCCAVIEFTGGPGSWITRTYAAARNAGATCNGKPIQVR